RSPGAPQGRLPEQQRQPGNLSLLQGEARGAAERDALAAAAPHRRRPDRPRLLARPAVSGDPGRGRRQAARARLEHPRGGDRIRPGELSQARSQGAHLMTQPDPFQIDAEVEVAPAGVRRIRQGHLWVYSSDVARDLEQPGPPIVRVLEGKGKTLGFAFHSPSSQIRLRLLTRGEAAPTADFLRQRISDAMKRRAPAGARSACRLVFGEAGPLPATILARYGEFLELQTLATGADTPKPMLAETLKELTRPALG